MARYHHLPKVEFHPERGVISWFHPIEAWWIRWKKAILVVVTLLLAGLASGLIVQAVSAYRESQAQTLLAEAVLAPVEQQAALNEELLGRYGKTTAAHRVRLQLAADYFERKDYAKLAEILAPIMEKSTAPMPIIVRGRELMAASYESQGDVAKARDIYMALYADAANPWRGGHYFQAARCYKQLGEVEKAREIWTTMVTTALITDPTLKEKSRAELLWMAANTK